MEKEKIFIQELYESRFQHCFGCGIQNNDGLNIKSYPSNDKENVICKFTPDSIYTGGVPNNLFGGMIAMIFDCHGTASAAYFYHKKKGLELKKGQAIDRFITARLEIDYKKPTPMGEEITCISKLENMDERKAIISMEIISGGITRAKAKMIAVKAKKDM